MTLFLIGLVMLVVGYYTYGRIVEKILQPDDRETPAFTKADGIDYVVLPKWKNMLIQLLNIAGVGPVLGAIMGIKFGPIVFLIIPLGNVFGGAVHDFASGMFSLRHGGSSLTTQMKEMMLPGMNKLMAVFMMFLLLLCVAVFINVPAHLTVGISQNIQEQAAASQQNAPEQVTESQQNAPEKKAESQQKKPEHDLVFFWWVVGAIFLYYIAATLFPVDKIIGKIYPFFGGMLLVGTLLLGISIVYKWFTGTEDFLAMTQAMTDAVPKQGPFIPCFFVTMACGVLSGFHATQSPIVARTMASEREARSVFYGMMIVEGIIAMIWAAGAMALYHWQPEMLTSNGNLVLGKVAQVFLGNGVGILTVLAVIILAITTGDTAMRSMRLSLAEMTHISQRSIVSRLMLSLPLIAIIAGLLIWSNRDEHAFGILWNYFAWGNQVLAASTLLGCTVWLSARRRCYWITLIPAVFMTFVVTSFILWAPHGFKLPQGFNLPQNVSYGLAAVIALGLGVMEVIRGRRMKEE